MPDVDVIDCCPLLSGFVHRHAARDLQSVRVIGDGCVLISSLKAGLSNVLDRPVSVAPLGVHLQVAMVLIDRRSGKRWIRENSTNFGVAEKVLPQLSAPLDVCTAFALLDRVFNC